MDRIVDLNGIPENYLVEKGLELLLEDEYLTAEGLLVHNAEQTLFKLASGNVYKMYWDCLNDLIKTKRLESTMELPQKMIALIEFSWKNRHQHILGRFDFGGGIDGGDPKLLEYNADTPTMLPESSHIQDQFRAYYSNPDVGQFNYIEENLLRAFNRLADLNKGSHHSMLFTTLGYEEDVINLGPLMDAARAAGFDVAYADLPDIEFDRNEGIFLESDDGEYVQYDYLYKLVPWEFICFEEPELLDILHDLITKDLAYVINPAYCIAFQSKQFLQSVYEMFPDSPYLLKTSDRASDFRSQQCVEKVSFGRLGENIKVIDQRGSIIEETKGDFGHFPSIFQEFVDLYKDEDGDLYQASVFTVDGIPSGLSFRRGEKLIIDDDAQFIPHFII